MICPCCGNPEAALNSPLLAVCDVLVVRALEVMGKRIVRTSRSRFKELGTLQWHEAHTLWAPDEDVVMKSLRNAWDVVPALVEMHGADASVRVSDVVTTLDKYVRDLLITGTPHTIEALHARVTEKLGIVVPMPMARPKMEVYRGE